MENMVLSLMINGMMALLLLATMIYCSKLSKRIRMLQDSRSELARIVREFDESTQRATASIAEIHAATSRLSENIQHKIDKANFIATDLEMMIEKGGRMTGRADAAPARNEAPMRLSRSAAAEAALAAAPQVHANPSAGLAAEAVAGVSPRPRPQRPRSRAEQELMNVLKPKE